MSSTGGEGREPPRPGHLHSPGQGTNWPTHLVFWMKRSFSSCSWSRCLKSLCSREACIFSWAVNLSFCLSLLCFIPGLCAERTPATLVWGPCPPTLLSRTQRSPLPCPHPGQLPGAPQAGLLLSLPWDTVQHNLRVLQLLCV